MNSRLKVLYIDFNLLYINPTRSLIPAVLSHVFDAAFFGPGYVDVETLRGGLDSFIEIHGPFDFVLANEHTLFSELWEGKSLSEGHKKNYARKFNDGYFRHATRMYKSFLSINAVKGALLFESDFHSFTQRRIQILESFDGVIIAPGEQFVRSVDELPFLKNEMFAWRVNDNWFHFVQQNRKRIISLPAFVSETEFFWLPIAERRVPWCVPGSRYWARKEAQKNLHATGIHYTGGGLRRIVSTLEVLHPRPYASPLLQKYLNYLFRKIIESAKYAYTCGSGVGYPIRKFFEIPGLGAVLACLPCNGFDALGFKDKVNALACQPENILEVHRFLEDNPEKAQAIADAGRKLIWEKHSTYARSIQLHETLLSIRKGEFGGSHWLDGNFYIVKETLEEQQEAKSKAIEL